MADCILKMSLLRPPSVALLAALQPLAVTTSNSMTNPQSDAWQKSLGGWRSFSLALFEYRRGNYQWHRKSVGYDPTMSSCGVTFNVLLAMVHYRAGQREQTRSELAQARQVIEAKLIAGQLRISGLTGWLPDSAPRGGGIDRKTFVAWKPIASGRGRSNSS